MIAVQILRHKVNRRTFKFLLLFIVFTDDAKPNADQEPLAVLGKLNPQQKDEVLEFLLETYGDTIKDGLVEKLSEYIIDLPPNIKGNYDAENA